MEVTEEAVCLADENHVVLDLNDAFLALLQRERDEVVGRSALAFTHPDDQEANQLLLDRLSSDNAPFAITKRYVRPDGSLLWVSNAVEPIADGLGPRRLCAISHPVDPPAPLSPLHRKLRLAKHYLTSIAQARALLGADVVSAPPLEMLLVLYVAELEGNAATIEQAAERLDVKQTVAAHWAKHLIGRGLIEVDRPTDMPRAGDGLRISASAEAALHRILRTDW